MPTEQKFTAGDWKLRDCWRLVKITIQYFFGMGFFYLIVTAAIWVYEAGSQSLFGTKGPVTYIWSEIPRWVKITSASFIVLLLFRGLTADLLTELGKEIEKLAEWLQKTSFKSRFFLLIAITSLILIFDLLSHWALAPWGLIVSIVLAYGEIKREKIEEMEAKKGQ